MHFWPGIVLRKQPLEASICYVSPWLQHRVGVPGIPNMVN